MFRRLLFSGLAAASLAGCSEDAGIGERQPRMIVSPQPLMDVLWNNGAAPVGVPVVFYLDIHAERADLNVESVNVLGIDTPTKVFWTIDQWEDSGRELPEGVKNVDRVRSGRAKIEVDTTLEWPFVFYSDVPGYYRSRVTFQRGGTGVDTQQSTEARAHAAVPDFLIYPMRLDFGRVPKETRGTARLVIENRSDLPMVVSTRFPDSQFFSGEDEPYTIPPRARVSDFTLHVEPRSDLALSSTVSLSVGDELAEVVRLFVNDCENGDPVAWDRDKDGFASVPCGRDCDDDNPNVHPGRPEVADGIDNDCNGLVDDGLIGTDNDGDGYCGHPTACYVEGILPGDCHDGDPNISPGERPEICPSNDPRCSDGIDNDCDGEADGGTKDLDGDGYVAPLDCDERDGTVAPNKPEIPDGKDNDCDGIIDEGTVLYDDDGDGYCEGMANPPPGVLPGTCSNVSYIGVGDCDDSVDPLRPEGPHPGARVFPGADENLDFGIDNNCNGIIDEGTDWYDDDGDGYTEEAGDCDDDDPNVGPFAIEIPGNGIDDDCDPSTPDNP